MNKNIVILSVLVLSLLCSGCIGKGSSKQVTCPSKDEFMARAESLEKAHQNAELYVYYKKTISGCIAYSKQIKNPDCKRLLNIGTSYLLYRGDDRDVLKSQILDTLNSGDKSVCEFEKKALLFVIDR